MKILTPAIIFLSVLLISYSCTIHAQSSYNIDSLKKILQTEKEDTNQLKTMFAIASYYTESHPDTGVIYSQQALNLAEKLNIEEAVLDAEGNLAICLAFAGNYPLGLDHAFKAISLAKKINPDRRGWAYSTVSYNYYYLGEYGTSLRYTREAMKIVLPFEIAFGWRDLSMLFHQLKEPDSAMIYAKKAYNQLKSQGVPDISNVLGNAYAGKGYYDSALYFYREGIPGALKDKYEPVLVDCYNNIAAVFKAMNRLDSSAWYCKKVLHERIEKSYPIGLLKATNLLADVYSSQNKPDSALKYLRTALTIKDSLFSREKTMAIQNVEVKEHEKQIEVEAAKLKLQNQLRTYAMLGGLFTLLAITGLLYRNNKQKQKAKTKIETAYAELKSAQAQLIQSEKMASLGELTAGIAHEIQNPLNFVNNFSEVNNELIEELKSNLSPGETKINSEEQGKILNDIFQNNEKINYHGKRADAIVKGMLQHSRSTSNTKELADINALADEYLRLAYHGLRAKDKSFNATLNTDFDESIGKINIVPQDIGRVLLNLYNNAFYAVSPPPPKGEVLISNKVKDPTIWVSTKKDGSNVLITVRDNGKGIPANIVDKIFQPFFTTKPTGQGTGLGLSLSYDIVKAHGGEIKVESKEGEARPPARLSHSDGDDPVGRGTCFIIQLPVV